MTPRPKTYQHVAYDPPIILRDNEQVIGRHVIRGGTLIGHVLFADPQPMVLIVGLNVSVKHSGAGEFMGTGGILRHA